MYERKDGTKEVAGEVFNPDESGSSRPTARGSERIRRGDKFMPGYTLEEMAKYVSGLGEGKERSVGIACVKRKEGKIMETISKEMLKPPSTIQSWLARGRDRGLYGLADKKPPGRPPTMGGKNNRNHSQLF